MFLSNIITLWSNTAAEAGHLILRRVRWAAVNDSQRRHASCAKIGIIASLQIFRSELSKPIGRGHPAIHREVAAGDKRAIRPHQQGADGAHLVRVPARPAAEISSIRR